MDRKESMKTLCMGSISIPLENGIREYTYESTIAGEPVSAGKVKAAMLSCKKL